MVNYITNLSKYIITVFMMLYTLECFLVFRFKEEKARRFTYIRQTVYLVIIQFSSFLSICLKTGNFRYLLFYAFFQIMILIFLEAVPMLYPNANRLLINNACTLISVGLIILVRLDYSVAVKQLIIAAFSFVFAAFIPFLMVKMKSIPNRPYFYGSFGVIVLCAVYLFGNITNGSRLSVSIAGISFMPSEFIKITFVFFIAGMLYLDTSIKTLVLTTVFAAAHICILALSNDLGAALIFYVIYVLMVFVATRSYLYLSVGTLAGVGAALLSYRLFRHVRVRVLAFIDPFSVIDNEGYQITQSLFALSSGSWFGMGLFNGTPETIPYIETDFIFSAITQEFGIVFSICLILICLSCFVMFINLSFKFNNAFYRYISVGLGIGYIFQVFLTVGGGTKFIPLSGVTLPLVSYGGSSLLATTFVFFIIEGMYILRGIDIKEKHQVENDPVIVHKQNNISLGITYFFTACFAALSIYLCCYVSINKIDFVNNAYNPVQEVLKSQNTRGPIFSRNNEILAETKVAKDGTEIRFYPFYNIFSHVIGYAENGKSGIESEANYYLINTNQPLADKMACDITGDKYAGDGIITTLDVGLQKAAFSAMGTYNGAVIVTNPKTGEILAMVSKPDFDPNEISLIWDELINDQESSVLLNRATQGLYPPGSVFKIVTALEYIKENTDSFNSYSYTCKGSTVFDDGKVSCYNQIVHGNVDFNDSFAESCNCSFSNIGLLLDRKQYQKTVDLLMFNDELPIPLNYAESSCHLDDDFSDLLMAQTSFGQGDTLMTPMHMNLITQAIANGGVLMHPYLISEVVNSKFDIIESFKPKEYKTLLSKEEASVLTDMMREVVTHGSAKKFDGIPVTVCGKTGTAEYTDYSSETHAWFTGFAPMDNPQIAVTVILENAGTGNTYAVPVARRIFEEYFKRFEDSEYIEEE